MERSLIPLPRFVRCRSCRFDDLDSSLVRVRSRFFCDRERGNRIVACRSTKWIVIWFASGSGRDGARKTGRSEKREGTSLRRSFFISGAAWFLHLDVSSFHPSCLVSKMYRRISRFPSSPILLVFIRSFDLVENNEWKYRIGIYFVKKGYLCKRCCWLYDILQSFRVNSKCVYIFCEVKFYSKQVDTFRIIHNVQRVSITLNYSK